MNATIVVGEERRRSRLLRAADTSATERVGSRVNRAAPSASAIPGIVRQTSINLSRGGDEPALERSR